MEFLFKIVRQPKKDISLKEPGIMDDLLVFGASPPPTIPTAACAVTRPATVVPFAER
jgi:hypothetical protein